MSSYFGQFNKVLYNGLRLRNIANRIGFDSRVLSRLEIFEPVRLNDGETAEKIAYDYYYNVNNLWLVMVTNNVIDPVYDWLLTQIQLDRMIEAKYDDPDGIRFYVYNGQEYSAASNLPDEISVDNPLVNIRTHREYEFELNEEKRNIRVIRNEFLSQILEEFREKIQSGAT